MNAHVIRISGSAWRPRKGGSVKLVIEVRPGTQAEWVDALEMFKQRPELSVTVVAPYVAPVVTAIPDKRYDRDKSSWSESPGFVKHDFSKVEMYPPGYDAIGPKADVDCPEPECIREFGHTEGHKIPPRKSDCPKPDCNMIAGHPGKCVKKKVAK